VNLWAFAMGYVAKALEKGFAASAENDWDPWFATIYLVNLLTQYQSNSVPQALELPYVVHCFGRAMVSKNVGFANGKITYTMVPQEVANPPNQMNIGFVGYGNQYNLGWVPEAFTMTGPFPNLSFSGAPGYTPELGAAAFSEMNTYLTGSDPGTDFRMVKSESPTPFDKDVSSYAIVSSQQGLGAVQAGSGGFGTQSQLEVPLFRPLLSLLVPYQENPPISSANRYPNLTVSTAGDPCFLGGVVGHTIPISRMGMKRYPKFHPVDFNEFLEVMALWVQALQTAAVKDPLGNWQESIAELQCPLTLQEFSFLLRNVMMEIFKDTQAGVQGLYPEIPASNSDNQFVAFTASAGTCFLQSIPVELPIALIENIRALAYRNPNRAEKKSGEDYEYFIPVLGMYQTDSLSSTDYTYSNTTDGTFTSFVIPTQAKYKKETFNCETGKKEVQLLPEVYINPIDGAAGGTAWAAVNNPATLTMLSQLWNQWLKDSGITTYSMTTGTASSEKGINILFSSNMTRHWFPASGGVDDVHGMRRLVSDRFLTQRNKALLVSPYATRNAVADSVQSIPLAAAYAQVQKIWILPLIESEINLAADNSTAPSRWQILMSEPYLMNASSGFDGLSLSEMHSVYAQKMTKGRDSPMNDWDVFFVEAAKQGRGGILSSLIGGALSSFFPQASGVINAVADIVPF